MSACPASNLSVARERLRLDTRLERFKERLHPLERLDDRDDGMPYAHDPEKIMWRRQASMQIMKRSGRCDQETNRTPKYWIVPHPPRDDTEFSNTPMPSIYHLLKRASLLHHGYVLLDNTSVRTRRPIEQPGIGRMIPGGIKRKHHCQLQRTDRINL